MNYTRIFNESYDVLFDENRGNRDAGIIGVEKYGNQNTDRRNVPEERDAKNILKIHIYRKI